METSKGTKPKLLVILGPTATGKSELAVKLAKKFNGEVISADARQVYRGLDIATGKITQEEMQGIPHHLISIADPEKHFTVVEYKKKAEKSIKEICADGKLPILCGGTGMYIEAVVHNLIYPTAVPNKKLRNALEKKDAIELFEMLKKKDPGRAESMDRKNKRRIIRALEIVDALGKVPSLKREDPYEILQIGLQIKKDELQKNISLRTKKREKKGIFEEAKRLEQEGLSKIRMDELGLEYRILLKYLKKDITKEEALREIETADLRYAKRQMTWFQRDKTIQWFYPEEIAKVDEQVLRFLKS